jgi:hypothetical protein
MSLEIWSEGIVEALARSDARSRPRNGSSQQAEESRVRNERSCEKQTVGMMLVTDRCHHRGASLSEALEAAGGTLADGCHSMRWATRPRTTIARTVADQMGLDFVDPPGYDIDPNAATTSRRSWLTDTPSSRSRSRMASSWSRCRILRTSSPSTICESSPATRSDRSWPTESDLLKAIDKFAASHANVDDMVGDLEDAVSVSDEDEPRSRRR